VWIGYCEEKGTSQKCNLQTRGKGGASGVTWQNHTELEQRMLRAMRFGFEADADLTGYNGLPGFTEPSLQPTRTRCWHSCLPIGSYTQQ
jgi:hypothetical protein